MLAIFLTLFLTSHSDTWYEADELSVGRIMTFGGMGNYAMAHYMGRTPGSFDVVIFDMTKQKGKRIKDGRLRVIRPVSFVYDGSFVLIDRIAKAAPQAHFISPDQGYHKTERLMAYSGWESGMMFVGIGQDEEGAPLLLYHASGKPDQIQVARMDFEKRQLHPTKTIKVDENQLLAIANGTVIRADLQTAAIKVLNAEDRATKTLFPAHDPIKASKSPLGKSKSNYKNLIMGSHVTASHLQFEYSDYYSEGAEPTKKSIYQIIRLDMALNLEIDPHFLIHEHQGKRLLFHFQDREFLFGD